jgi:hypothetical protein
MITFLTKIIFIFFLIFLSCSTQKNIPESKFGESFYSESYEDGLDIIKTMYWELIYTDTIRQKDYRDVYLFHYKILK